MSYTEFSAYGPYAKTVEQLVEHDIGAKYFFEDHKSDALPVIYIPGLHLPRRRIKIIKPLQASPNFHLIIATTIALQNIDKGEKPIRHINSTHSILLLWDGITMYLYDPNGNYNIEYQSWVYKIYRGPGQQSVEFPSTTEAAAQQLAHLLQIPFMVPTTVGIQVLNQTIADSPYIGRGGYCMFYNWLAIHFVKTFQKSEQGWMVMAYNQLCSAAAVVAAGGHCHSIGSIDGHRLCTSWGPFFPAAAGHRRGIFLAPPNTLEGQTVRIIKSVWPNALKGGGNRARRRRKHRSKRRNSRRRHRSKKKNRKRFTCKRKKLRRKKLRQKKRKTRRNKRTRRTR